MRTNLFSMFMFLLLWRGLEGGLLFAQADVCAGTPYTINSAMDASGASTYQWLENGKIITGAKDPTYTVLATKAVGNYSYIRQAKSADCDEWQSSNEFTVTVFNCSFTAGSVTSATATYVDPRDGKKYKTVVMPDGKTWFAQNLNYTKDLTRNTTYYEANGKPITVLRGGPQAIGSYWCSAVPTSVKLNNNVADDVTCSVYGALYTWTTAMMIDGKYADGSKKESAWRDQWNNVADWTTADYIATSPKAKNSIARNSGQGICPMGWEVPTLYDWALLIDTVAGGSTFRAQGVGWKFAGAPAGHTLKSSLTSGTCTGLDGAWVSSEQLSADPFGFSLHPCGYVEPNNTPWQGISNACTECALWTASTMYFNTGTLIGWFVDRDGARWGADTGSQAYGVRCLRK
jgi:uncharacterized protein (TIGR02145 family)